MLTPEQELEAAEKVRLAHKKARSLAKAERKIAAGHEHLVPFRDRLRAELGCDR